MFSIFDHLAKHAPGGEGLAWRDSRHGSLSRVWGMPWSPLNRLLNAFPIKLYSWIVCFGVVISYRKLNTGLKTALMTVKQAFRKCAFGRSSTPSSPEASQLLKAAAAPHKWGEDDIKVFNSVINVVPNSKVPSPGNLYLCFSFFSKHAFMYDDQAQNRLREKRRTIVEPRWHFRWQLEVTWWRFKWHFLDETSFPIASLFDHFRTETITSEKTSKDTN